MWAFIAINDHDKETEGFKRNDSSIVICQQDQTNLH